MTIDKDFPDLETRTAEALEEIRQHFLSGEPLPNTQVFHRRAVDVPALRDRYGLTQQAFADKLRISVGTLRNWEQKRRIPDGPAQRLLELMEDRPDVAADIFSRDARPAPEAPEEKPKRRAAGGRR